MSIQQTIERLKIVPAGWILKPIHGHLFRFNVDELKALVSAYERLQKREARLRAALAIYAKPESWISDGIAGYSQYFCNRDEDQLVFVSGETNGYEIAREALKDEQD